MPRVLPNIEELLKELAMEKYTEQFNKEEVNTQVLSEMEEEDIKDLFKECGISVFGQRLKLLNKIRFLKASSNSPKASALISDQSRVPDTLDNSNSTSILSSTILDSTSNSTAAAMSHIKTINQSINRFFIETT